MNTDEHSAAPARIGAAGRFRLTVACAGALSLLAACGGGGDGASPVAPAQPMATTLTGTAATGAALAGATVQVTDQTGATVCDTTTDALGVFTCPLPAGTPRPLVLRAARDETVLYSTTATTGDVTANITPLTTIIASRLAPDGNPATLSTTVRTTPQTVTADTLRAQTDALIAALQPLLTALGISTIDPLAGVLVANGTGQDQVLDAIAVTVRPDGTASNIEITVKTVPTTANPDPVSIRFRSSAAAVPALPASVAAATVDLRAIPAPSVVASFMSRLTACYALPLSQRVNAPNDTASVVGTASDVIAPACRTLFVGDDPTTYLSSGSRVGRSASNTGSFAGLFRPGATGVVFSNGVFEYFRGNGDMIVSAKTVDLQGNTANDTYVVRNVGSGVLKLIGNQYVYSSAVRPIAQDRELVNSPQFSYYSTGYNIRVDNRTDSAGNPVFSKVLVTGPLGGTITLVPTAGQSLLAIAPDGVTASSTSVLRLAAGYYDAALVTSHPSVKEPTLVYTSPLRSDADIAALTDRGLWTFEFFHADTSVANVVQTNRTLVRPYTIGEIRQRPFAQFTAAARADLIAESPLGYAIFTVPETAQIGDAATPAWTVPTGALAPTSLGVSGRAPFGSTTAGVSGNRFNDNAGVASTARFGTVFCSAQTSSDRHCATNGLYAINTTVNFIELWGLGEKQAEISKAIGLYRLQ